MNIWHIFKTDISCWIKDHNLLLKLVKTELLVVSLNPSFPHNLKAKVTTYSQIWWPLLEILALHLPIQVHTHSSEHTHREHTHPEQWPAIYAAAPGEQLGVRCLAQGHLVMVLKVERALYIHRQDNSQPFDYKSDSLPLGHDFPWFHLISPSS